VIAEVGPDVARRVFEVKRLHLRRQRQQRLVRTRADGPLPARLGEAGLGTGGSRRLNEDAPRRT
jgi:hypothetical protein